MSGDKVKNNKKYIRSFIGYGILSALIVLIVIGVWKEKSLGSDYSNAPRVYTKKQAEMLENYTGLVVLQGKITSDAEEYCYYQRNNMERRSWYNSTYYRYEEYWGNIVENPVYGENTKIFGFDIDLSKIHIINADDSGGIVVSDTEQYQIYSIKNDTIVTMLAEWESGRFLEGEVISVSSDVDVVVDILNIHFSSEVIFSKDIFGIKFISLMIEAIIMYILIKYVFLIPVLLGIRSKHIFGGFIVLICCLYEMTDSIYAYAIFQILCLALLMFYSKGLKLEAVLEWITVSGLSSGLITPIVVVPARFMEETGYNSSAYRAIAYGSLCIICLLFYFFGKNWRKNFREKMLGRKPALWGQLLAFVTGLFMFGYNSVITTKSDVLFGQANINIQIMEIAAGWIGLLSIAWSLTVISTIMISNKRSYYHYKVNDMQFNTIVMMAEIVENRDSNTGGHIQRTARYVEILARELRNEGKYKEILTENYISEMRLAATLHDVGKIHVSDLILNKNGRLTEEEFEIMKTHVEAGRKLLIQAKEYLGDFEYLNIAIDMASGHHEWWDGSAKGYPDHIKGEEIPLCARIMAVADVFDALTSKRVYKAPMPIEEAYSIICNEKGTHFDPDIIVAFEASRKEFNKTLEAYRQESPVQ